jgi:hypothetical protein
MSFRLAVKIFLAMFCNIFVTLQSPSYLFPRFGLVAVAGARFSSSEDRFTSTRYRFAGWFAANDSSGGIVLFCRKIHWSQSTVLSKKTRFYIKIL